MASFGLYSPKKKITTASKGFGLKLSADLLVNFRLPNEINENISEHQTLINYMNNKAFIFRSILLWPTSDEFDERWINKNILGNADAR